MSNWILVQQHGSDKSMLLNADNGLAIYPSPVLGECIMSQTGSSYEKSFNPAFKADIDTMAVLLNARSFIFELPALPKEGSDIRFNESGAPVLPAKPVRMND